MNECSERCSSDLNQNCGGLNGVHSVIENMNPYPSWKPANVLRGSKINRVYSQTNGGNELCVIDSHEQLFCSKDPTAGAAWKMKGAGVRDFAYYRQIGGFVLKSPHNELHYTRDIFDGKTEGFESRGKHFTQITSYGHTVCGAKVGSVACLNDGIWYEAAADNEGQVSQGQDRRCGAKDDSTGYCFYEHGRNGRPETVVLNHLSWQKVVAAGPITCGLSQGGEIWCNTGFLSAGNFLFKVEMDGKHAVDIAINPTSKTLYMVTLDGYNNLLSSSLLRVMGEVQKVEIANRQDSGLVVTQHNLEAKAGNKVVSWIRVPSGFDRTAQFFYFDQKRIYFAKGYPRLCLDTKEGVMNSEVAVAMEECVQGKKSQDWIYNAKTGLIQLLHRRDLCLDIHGGTIQGMDIYVHECHGGGKWENRNMCRVCFPHLPL